MRRAFSVLTMLLVFVSLASGYAGAQTADPNTPVSSAAEPGVAGEVGDPAAAQVAPAAGAPESWQTAGPPRTLRAYWHVFIAFGLAWVLLFGYAISVGRRFSRLEQEVRSLHGELPAA